MNPRTLLSLFVVVGLLTSTYLTAQTKPSTTKFDTSVASFNALGNRQDQDETDKQALAKQMDDFHQRLKQLEATAAKSATDQEAGSFADRISANTSKIEDFTESIEGVEEALDGKADMGHDDETMKLSGRIHLDYWGFAKDTPGIVMLEGGDPNDRIIFRRVRLGAGGNINDNMLYRLESEWAGGNDFQFRDVYIGFTNLPRLQTLLIGNQKRPYGLDHLNSSRFNVFMERPFIIEAFNQDSRRLGIASYGYSRDLCNNWRFGIYNQELIQRRSGYIGDHYQMEIAGRLARNWWWDEASNGRGYGHVAISGSWGVPDGLGNNSAVNAARYATRPEARSTIPWLDTGAIAGAKSFALIGLESVTNVGPLQIVAEYQVMDVDRFDFFGSRVFLHGGYVYASYFLTGEHVPWVRTRGVLGRVKPFENFFSVCDCDGFRQRGRGAWQVAARLSHADLTDENIIGGRGTSMTLGLNWHWNPYARMQFNYIFGDIDRQATGAGTYQIAGIRFMVDF